MKLIAATKTNQSGDCNEVLLQFEGGIRKYVSGRNGSNKQQRQYMVYRALLEAERDFAYRKHGDDWPNHAAKKGEPFKFTCTTEAEHKIIDGAVRMLGDE